MYGWFWRNLPGGLPGRLIGSTMLAVSLVYLLFTVVFPWLEPKLPFNDVTIE